MRSPMGTAQEQSLAKYTGKLRSQSYNGKEQNQVMTQTSLKEESFPESPERNTALQMS